MPWTSLACRGSPATINIVSDEREPVRSEGVTMAALEARLVALPPEEAARIRASARPAAVPVDDDGKAPEPLYISWSDFLRSTTESERRAWCSMKARRANRERLMSGRPDTRIGWGDVWSVLSAARGRCEFCGSLAVERRPSTAKGGPAPWASVGRRIGSLSHAVARVNGGPNTPENLGWACLWCNTWPSERILGATDHGGIQSDRAG